MTEIGWGLLLSGAVAALAGWAWWSLPRPPVTPADRLEAARAPRVVAICLLFFVLLLIGHFLF